MFICDKKCLLSLLLLSFLAAPSLAFDNVYARLTSAPQQANVGNSVRVISAVLNAGRGPQRVRIQVWLLRPWGQQALVGSSEIQLRPGQQAHVGTPGVIPETVHPGGHTIGIVVITDSGRFIADHQPIRILPARE